MSPNSVVGDYTKSDILIEGGKIVSIGPNIGAGDAIIVQSDGMVVMIGFVDTHHQPENHEGRFQIDDGDVSSVRKNDGCTPVNHLAPATHRDYRE